MQNYTRYSSLLDYLLDAVQKLDAAKVDISGAAAASFMSAYNFYQKRPSKKSGTSGMMLKSASANLITWMQQMMSMRKCKKIFIKEALIYILDFIPTKQVR